MTLAFSSGVRVGLASLAVACAVFCQTAEDRRVAPINAHKRLALVIGNEAYLNKPLANPLNDARAMSQRLRELGFETTLLTNADRKSLGKGIDRFVDKLGTGDVAFFYYSGHGMQVGNENYLIPVDYQGQNETDVRYDAQPATGIQQRMEKSGARLSILVFDACRNNPYHSSSRSAGAGLAAMSPGKGTFIAFAAAPGSTASDNSGGRNGLFTQYLLEALSVPGLSLNDVFDLVREKVAVASEGHQMPWTLSSVVGSYSFMPGTSDTTADTAPLLSAPVAANVPHHHSVTDRPPAPLSTMQNEKDGLIYVWISPGSFHMGCSPGGEFCRPDERPVHDVSITKGFWLAQTLVTQAAWKRVMGTDPSHFKGDDRPVERVNWDDSRKYCKAIGGRLPSEAEWEYAARAGAAGARYGDLNSIAWYGGNSAQRTHPVGAKQANPWKLYDMLGNVMQWTSDRYSETYYDRGENTDPHGPSYEEAQNSFPPDERVLRGGGWRTDFLSVSLRSHSVWTFGKDDNIGFRCVAEPSDGAQ